ncbi:MAG TPA: hypothetical protein VLM40_21930 [Gemmata sp.]|nr:hypothetical protein [Gemmata sp.]
MRTRQVILFLAVLVALIVGGFAAYHSPWVRAWFARDSENLDEMTRLGHHASVRTSKASLRQVPPRVG